MKVTTVWCDWCRKMIEEGEYFYISSPDELDEPMVCEDCYRVFLKYGGFREEDFFY